ncbi:MAG TPA: chloramphenicol acetyltransferase [Anaerolineales bacterium]
MRVIDMQTWPRREHFRLFSSFDHPHFGMSANVDVTPFHRFIKQHGYSFTVAVAFVIARAANGIPEFRWRIRGDQVVEHDTVHPSFSILVKDDLFSFCPVEFTEDFAEFAARAAESIARVKAHPVLENDLRDDMLYMSPIPWVSFTSFMHPMQLHPADSVPRFAWGKMFEEGGSLKMPLAAQGHHAVMDGIHVGWFYEKAQDYLSNPEPLLREG